MAVVKEKATGNVYAMKILNKWEMLKRAEVRSSRSLFLLYSVLHILFLPVFIFYSCFDTIQVVQITVMYTLLQMFLLDICSNKVTVPVLCAFII